MSSSYVHIILGSVKVGEWPPFGKELFTWLTVCSLYYVYMYLQF